MADRSWWDCYVPGRGVLLLYGRVVDGKIVDVIARVEQAYDKKWKWLLKNDRQGTADSFSAAQEQAVKELENIKGE